MEYRRRVCFALLLVVYAVTAGRAWGQLNPGVVVEEVTKNTDAEKTGLQEGDVLLAWSRHDVRGEIESPFDLYRIAIEQVQQSDVTLEGLRGTEKRTWRWTQEIGYWMITARPNLPPNLLSMYVEGEELAKAGKLTQAVERWQAAANQADGQYAPWLAAWFWFHAALRLTDMAARSSFDVTRLNEADALYQQAVQHAKGAGPAIEAQLLGQWASTYSLRDRAIMEKYLQQALRKSQEYGADTLLVASALEDIANQAAADHDLPKAQDYLRQALSIRQKVTPETHGLAATLHALARVATDGGSFSEAEEYERQALAIYEKRDPNSIAVAVSLNLLGAIAYDRGDLSRAEDYYQRGLAIGEQHPSSIYGIGINLSGLGAVALQRGDLRAAEQYHRRGLVVREQSFPGTISVARNLSWLAEVFWQQGDLDQAAAYSRRALAIIEQLAPTSVWAAEIFTMHGRLATDRGDLVGAEEYFRKSLTIHERAATDTLAIADDLNDLGRVLCKRHELASAEEHLRRALAVGQKLAPASSYVADSLHLLGNVAQDRGDLVQAKEYYSQALSLREKLAPGGPDHVDSLAALASLTRRMQQPDAAAELYEQVLKALESQVSRSSSAEETRSNFRARHAGYYKDYMDLLLAQKQTERAFQVLELSRARSLLEMLGEVRLGIRKGVDSKLADRERSLRADIAAKSDGRIRLLSGQHTDQQVAAVDKEIHELVSQYHQVEDQIRAGNPAYAALTQPQPLSAREVQEQLLDADTLLLEYSLGMERSYVFLLTPGSLAAYELPPRAEVETLARQVHVLATARTLVRAGETPLQKKTRLAKTDREYAKATAKLGRMLLGPLASQLQGKRLLMVSDGALQYVPFSILPEPARNSPSPVPLIAGHEIVNLPSASVLAVLRREALGRKPPSQAVAVLADPVFNLVDARVAIRVVQKRGGVRPLPEAAKPSADDLSEEVLTRSVRDLGLLSLPRLPFTRQEAEAIISVTPSGEGMKALDFRASRELSMSPDLAKYRMVHLATHGLVDSEHPELSGLVLSLVDKQGKRKNGFLGLDDIYNLDLPVDMVVLSACETGLGKEISGEGLVGLTRGFMYAGASRVVASLWSVDDVATAELMGRFYRGILRQGLSPAAALRQAQIGMWKQKRWHNPYYWGAFVLQGEWKAPNGQDVQPTSPALH